MRKPKIIVTPLSLLQSDEIFNDILKMLEWIKDSELLLTAGGRGASTDWYATNGGGGFELGLCPYTWCECDNTNISFNRSSDITIMLFSCYKFTGIYTITSMSSLACVHSKNNFVFLVIMTHFLFALFANKSSNLINNFVLIINATPWFCAISHS